MKTKHLLTALALPAIFAACTADDIETVGVKNTERAALNENFKMDFGGVESRMTAGKPGESLVIKFQPNDVVGGAIVDTYDGTDYDVVDYVSTNHPFVFDGSTWNIEHTMVEGNYLFYYPYNENNHSRSAASYSIPVMQDLSDKVTGEFNPKAAVERYAMAVGHRFLDKEDLSANAELAPIFSYARLVLKLDNAYAGGEIDKIVLQAANEFKLNGQISNTKVYGIFDAIEKAKTADEIAAIWAANNQTAHYALDATLENTTTSNPYYNEKLNKGSKVMVGKLPAGVSLKVDAQNNKSFETYMVMPAQSVEDMIVYLYMKDGRVYSNYKEAVDATFNRNTPKKVEVTLVKSDEVPYIVTSEKDWNEYVSLMGKNPAEFIIAGDEFTVTNTTEYPTAKEAIITVKSALKVTGDNVTMKNIVAAENVTVEKGAVLNTDKTATYATITNKGTLNITKVVDAEGDVVTYAAGEILNEVGATLNVNDKAAVSMKLNNKIDKTSKQMPRAAVVNNGTIEFAEGSQNSGEITNNGSLIGEFTNNAKVVCTKDAKINFTPIITNNGEIFATGAWVNNGKLINAKDAEISVSKVNGGASFANKGTLKLADGSFCLITTNEGGEIILEKLNQENWTAADGKGTVAYTTVAGDAGKSYDFTTTGKNITKLYLNGSLGVTKVGNKLATIIVEKDAVITMPAEGTIANLTVNKNVAAAVKSTTVSNEIKPANFTNVTVEEGATLTVNEGHALKCAIVNNEGTIYVGGSFEATETLQDEAGNGKFKTTSTTGNISFGGQTDAQKKEAEYKAALKEYVSVSIDNANLSTVNSWTAVETFLSTQYVSVDAVLVKANAMIAKYNSWKGTNKDQSDVSIIAVANEGNSSYLKAAIASLKTAADATVKAAIQAKVKDNSWIGTAAYVKAEEDASVIEIMNGSTALNDAFATYIATLSWDIKSSADETAEDYEVTAQTWLSIKGITADRYYDAEEEEDLNMNEIPEYSFINTYKTSMEFKMMKLWIEVTANSNTAAWYVDDLKNKIQSPATVPYIAEGFMTFVNEAYKLAVSDKYKNDLQVQKILGELKTNASTIINWEYTGKQYYALYLAVTAAN